MGGPAGRKTGSFIEDRRLTGAKLEVWGLARALPHTKTQKLQEALLTGVHALVAGQSVLPGQLAGISTSVCLPAFIKC